MGSVIGQASSLLIEKELKLLIHRGMGFLVFLKCLAHMARFV